MVYVMMGVSGSGKTVVGMALAKRLGLPFHDGDDFHPARNVAKMKAGIPLEDTDREPWLRALADKIRDWNAAQGAVLACSALKEEYRQILRTGGAVRFILLQGSKELLAERLRHRKGHYMPASLLESQLATLEIPSEAIPVGIEKSVEKLVEEIFAALEKTSG